MFLEISQTPQPATLFKKRLWHRGFHVNFAKFLRIPFLQNTFGGLVLNIPSYVHQASTQKQEITLLNINLLLSVVHGFLNKLQSARNLIKLHVTLCQLYMTFKLNEQLKISACYTFESPKLFRPDMVH